MDDAARQLLNLSQKQLDQLPAAVRQKIEAVRRQVLAAQRLRTVQTARDSLLDFTQMSMPDPANPDDVTQSRYKVHPIHEFLAKKLEAVERGELLRLIISVQPRVGKSELVSKKFPAWLLGRDPYRQVIATSYGEELSKEFGRDVRATMKSAFYQQVFPGVTLRKGSQAMDRLQTEDGGIANFVGAGGALTGRGADCVSFATRCITVDGDKPISDIRVGDKVLAHDHILGKDVWTTVRAVSSQYKPDLISVGSLRCTPDHRVWTEEWGYVEAERAQAGTPRMCGVPARIQSSGERAPAKPAPLRGACEDVLLEGVRPEAQGAETPDMQVWRGEGETRTHMHRLLHEEPENYFGVRGLWRVFQKTIQRARESSEVTRRGCLNVLQSAMLRQVSQGEHCASACARFPLPDLWRPYRVFVPAQVLLAGVLPHTEEAKHRVRGRMEQAPPGDSKARQRRLCELWRASQAGDRTSRRSRRDEPSHGQSSATLRAVSHPLSSAVLGTSAGDLARLLPEMGGHLVADIQTDAGNFFANGILAHNCLLIDDILKDAEEARSKSTKDKHWEWFTRVALSRVMGIGGAVVITMTRWAEDDLIGRLTDPELGYVSAEDAAQWQVVNIPAFAEEDDPLGRKPGEILWPERTPEAFLHSFRRLDPGGFAALYMGKPAPPEGNFFKREHLRTYQAHELPSNLRYYAASDHAISTEQRRDSTVLGVVGVDEEDNIWVLPDLVWAQLDSEDQVEAMLALIQQHKPLAWWAEKGHISKSIGPFLRKRMQEEETYCAISEKTPVKDKQTRAQSIQARMSMGKVYLPSFAPWYADGVEQLLNFPNGAHDDFVDFLAWIGLGLTTQVRASSAVQPRKEPPRSGSLEWILQTSERIRKGNTATESLERYLH